MARPITTPTEAMLLGVSGETLPEDLDDELRSVALAGASVASALTRGERVPVDDVITMVARSSEPEAMLTVFTKDLSADRVLELFTDLGAPEPGLLDAMRDVVRATILERAREQHDGGKGAHVA